MYNVRKDEVNKLVILFSMLLIIACGYAIAYNILHTVLIKRFSIEYLPYSYTLFYGFGLLSNLLYFFLITRFQKEDLLIGYSFFSCLLVIFSSLLLQENFANLIPHSDLLFYGCISFAQGNILTLSASVWSLINESFRPAQGRRLYPILGTARLIGGLSIGILLAFFATWLSISFLIVVWGILFLILSMLGIVFKKYLIVYRIKSEAIGVKEAIQYASKSPTVKILIAIIIFVSAMSTYEDLTYTQVMNLTFHDEASLAQFFGFYFILWNLTAITLQFFAASKFIYFTGVFRGLMVLPLAASFGFFYLLFKFQFWPGFLLNYSWDVINIVIQYNAYQLSFNIVPKHLKDKIRSLTDGIANCIGGAIGGLSLISIQYFTRADTKEESFFVICSVALVLCLSWFIFSIVGRKYYVSDLINNLNQKNVDELTKTIEALEERKEPRLNKVLIEMIKKPPLDSTVNLTILEVLARLGTLSSIRVICLYVQHTNETLRLHALMAINTFSNIKKFKHIYYYLTNEIIEIFHNDPSVNVRREAGRYLLNHLPDQELYSLIQNLIIHKDASIRVLILQIVSKLKMQLLDVIGLKLLQDVDPYVSGEALVLLWNFTEYENLVDETMYALITSESAYKQKIALSVLIRVKDIKKYYSYLKVLQSSSNLTTSLLAKITLLGSDGQSEEEKELIIHQILQILINPECNESTRQEFINHLIYLRDELIDEVILSIQMLTKEEQLIAKRGMEKIAAQLYQKVIDEI